MIYSVASDVQLLLRDARFTRFLAAQVIGQSMIAYAFAHLPATFGSLGLYLQPVIAALYARFLLGEALQLVQIAGGLIVLLAIALARHASQPRPIDA